ncbi:MAG: chitobiase/beta-hexosaminidase C-terminal domain-containing protein [Oscillospiraceae bacterium]|nr:chitobiase/beta-hexosaminidase C-terminal domain-containing protein [Oscillospiraceae bacterium]
MNTANKRSVIPLIIIILLCGAACSSVQTMPALTVPETPAGDVSELGESSVLTEKQANTFRETGETISGSDETAAEVSVTPRPAGDSKQGEKPEGTGFAETPAAASSGPVILTVSGEGTKGETAWSFVQLEAMSDGYREFVYSTTNNWPSFGQMEAGGVSLPYFLQQAGIKDNAVSFKFMSTDGYYAVLTYEQIFGTRYSFANHGAFGSSGAFPVEPVIAWVWGDAGKARRENIRPFFGQSGPWEVNTASFVKDLSKIEVSTVPAGSWAAPEVSVPDTGPVSAGTELMFLHENMDSVRIYYTQDGSEPDYLSSVYNPSASYFQPQLNVPLTLTESVTVKAFAAGFGKDKSQTVTFDYIVEQ